MLLRMYVNRDRYGQKGTRNVGESLVEHPTKLRVSHRLQGARARLKHDGTCAETRFGLSTQRTSPFKSAGGGGGVVSLVGYWQPRCAHQR